MAKKTPEKLGISKRKKRLTEIVRKIGREGKAGLRGEGCEGCWIKHVEIRSVQQALKNLAGPRLNSKAQRIRGRNLLELPTKAERRRNLYLSFHTDTNLYQKTW